jgi:hypothetical protein
VCLHPELAAVRTQEEWNSVVCHLLQEGKEHDSRPSAVWHTWDESMALIKARHPDVRWD